MAGRMRVKGSDRWREHLAACFARGVREYKEGAGRQDCPYSGKGVDAQRKAEWEKGFSAAERKYGKLREDT